MVSTAYDGQLIIFTGRFGSGKTEIALNFVASLVQRQVETQDIASLRPILIDLDIVTPYFRSREAMVAMREHGVEVVAPPALTGSVDVPALTPQILGAIEQRDRLTVLDVGGDEQGARALGRYSQAVQQRSYTMNFVVNPYRPYTATPQAIRSSIQGIERSSRLAVSALVSNPNLMSETDVDVIMAGHQVVLEAALLTGLPVAFLSVLKPFAAALARERVTLPVLPLRRYFALPWEDRGDSVVIQTSQVS